MRQLTATSDALMRARLRDRFLELYDAEPARIGYAPGRVNLIGEHTDYNGGACLPIPLSHGTWAAVSGQEPGALRVASGAGQPVTLDTGAAPSGAWTDYVAGVFWAAGVSEGRSVLVDSTVPIGAGLSSSAALECAVGVAIGLAGQELCAAGIKAEREYVGAPTGGLDQTVAVFGSRAHALLLDFADGSRTEVPFDPAAADLGLLVIDTHVKHALADTGGGYAQRARESAEAAAALGVEHLASAPTWLGLTGVLAKRARHVITETARVHQAAAALTAGHWQQLGELMNQSHDSLRDDYQVSCAELDAVVDACRESGALGARMTGGGFGGSAIALVPLSRIETALAQVQRRFVDEGWDSPSYLLAEAGPGAF